MITEIKRFNIRVYGLLLHNNQVLISKEQYQDRSLVKFPGGGVEFGEGVIETLKREFREELQAEIIDYDIFHVTEELIPSAFDKTEQVIAIYYLVETNSKSFIDMEHEVYWQQLHIAELESIQFTFKQEQIVFTKLCKKLDGE